jgi:hypothetical protein
MRSSSCCFREASTLKTWLIALPYEWQSQVKAISNRFIESLKGCRPWRATHRGDRAQSDPALTHPVIVAQETTFGSAAAAVIALANRKDLALLKRVLENPGVVA